MESLYRNYGLLKGILMIGVVSIALQIYGGYIQNKLLIQCSQVGDSKDPWVKMVISKFKACCKLHLPPGEVSLFVDRHLLSYKAHGINMSTWCSMGIYGTWVIGMIFGAATLTGVSNGTSITTYVTYCIYTLLTVATIFGTEMFLQFHRKQELIRTCLWDYLQNTLLPRIVQDAHPEQKKQYLQEYFIPDKKKDFENSADPEMDIILDEEDKPASSHENDSVSDELLTEIIQEYIS